MARSRAGSRRRLAEMERMREPTLDSDAALHRVLDALPDIVFTADVAGRCGYVNAAYCEVTGMAPSGALGEGWMRALHPDDGAACRERWRQAVATGQPLDLELRFRRADGRYRRFMLRSRPVRDAEGRVRRWIGTCSDIGELVAARRASEAKTRFFAAASHDLRQPFQAMRLFLHILERRLHDEETQMIVGNLGDSMTAGETLLSTLLDMATLEAGSVRSKVKVLAASELVQRLGAEFLPQARSKGLAFKCRSPGVSIRSDPVLLERILRNLLSNAIRYTGTGRILLGCRRRGAALRIEVWDTGPGIPDDKLNAIFEEFYQLDGDRRDGHEQGLGLGLAIVERLARLLDHRLDVRSRVGRGSMFAVEVPVAAAMPPVAAASGLAPRLEGIRVLLIDGSAAGQSELAVPLEQWSCEVALASSLEAALAHLDAGRVRPDIAVVGRWPSRSPPAAEAVQRVRDRLRRRLPAVVVADLDDAAPLPPEPSRCLRRPVEPEPLGLAIAELLGL